MNHHFHFSEPDIVSGDGVYSRYLTKYPATGRYSFTISVDDNNNQAVFVTKGEPIVKKPPNAGVSTRYGSTVPIPPNRKKKIGVFEPGQSISHVINFKYYNKDYYVGTFFFDEFGNRKNMSNIVLVNVPAPPAEDQGNCLQNTNKSVTNGGGLC